MHSIRIQFTIKCIFIEIVINFSPFLIHCIHWWRKQNKTKPDTIEIENKNLDYDIKICLVFVFIHLFSPASDVIVKLLIFAEEQPTQKLHSTMQIAGAHCSFENNKKKFFFFISLFFISNKCAIQFVSIFQMRNGRIMSVRFAFKLSSNNVYNYNTYQLAKYTQFCFASHSAFSFFHLLFQLSAFALCSFARVIAVDPSYAVWHYQPELISH